MMLIRQMIVLGAVLLAGFHLPVQAAPIQETGDGSWTEQVKPKPKPKPDDETPPRPKPKPGPREGGEDE